MSISLMRYRVKDDGELRVCYKLSDYVNDFYNNEHLVAACDLGSVCMLGDTNYENLANQYREDSQTEPEDYLVKSPWAIMSASANDYIVAISSEDIYIVKEREFKETYEKAYSVSETTGKPDIKYHTYKKQIYDRRVFKLDDSVKEGLVKGSFSDSTGFLGIDGSITWSEEKGKFISETLEGTLEYDMNMCVLIDDRGNMHAVKEDKFNKTYEFIENWETHSETSEPVVQEMVKPTAPERPIRPTRSSLIGKPAKHSIVDRDDRYNTSTDIIGRQRSMRSSIPERRAKSPIDRQSLVDNQTKTEDKLTEVVEDSTKETPTVGLNLFDTKNE